MNPDDLLRTGRLTAAIEQLNQDVRAHPGNSRLRTSLFEALCFAGDYQRAQRQLDVLAQLDPRVDSGVAIYRQILSVERSRLEVAEGEGSPAFLLEPPPFAALYLAAFRRLHEGKAAEARTLLIMAMESQPAVSGKLDGKHFNDFSDSDPFYAPFLEVFIDGRYVWLPFVQVKRLAIQVPSRLRDLLWAEATLETVVGPSGSVLIPVLYSGSFRHPDEQVRLGRATVWNDVGENLMRGSGQRMFLIDDDEKPMLHCREIEFAAA